MKILILAGGFGTRLKSVVNDVPKPMAPIADKPFLDYQIKEIRKYFPKNKIYLLTHYLSEVVEKYYSEDKLITVIKENIPLGTGGSIKNAIKELNLKIEESILVFNGDTYIKPDLNNMLKNTKNDLLILAAYQETCDRYGTLTIRDDKIIDFNEKRIGVRDSYINAGCYFFKNLTFFEAISEREFSLEKKFEKYVLKNNIDVFRYNEIFIDIGIPEDYKKMINYVRQNECK